MMANAKECDICKKLYKPKEKKDGDLGLIKTVSSDYWHTIDLCPSCQLELEKWYASKKKTK